MVFSRIVASLAHTFIYRALLKYSNRTYTCTQNTLIEQSFPSLDKRGPDD